MNLLLIDTSNQPMSIALMNDDEVLAIKQQIVKDHSSQLMPGIQSLFNESNLKTRIRWDCCCKRTWLLYRSENRRYCSENISLCFEY